LLAAASDQIKKPKKTLKEKPILGDELPLVRPPQKQLIGSVKMSQNIGLPILEKKSITNTGKGSRNTSRQRSKGRLTPQHALRNSPDGKPLFVSSKSAEIPEKMVDLGAADLSTNPTLETPTNSTNMSGKPSAKFGQSKGWSKREAFQSTQPEYGEDELRTASKANASGPGRSLPRLGGRTGASSSSAIVSQKREASRPEGKEKERGTVGKQTPSHTAKVLLSGLRSKDSINEIAEQKPKPKAKPSAAVVEKISNMVVENMCAKSQAGFSEGKTKTNQDTTFSNISLKSSPNCALLGVFDGHGIQGHKVSGFIKNNLKSRLGFDCRQFRKAV
jgi:hypothetical protein